MLLLLAAGALQGLTQAKTPRGLESYEAGAGLPIGNLYGKMTEPPAKATAPTDYPQDMAANVTDTERPSSPWHSIGRTVTDHVTEADGAPAASLSCPAPDRNSKLPTARPGAYGIYADAAPNAADLRLESTDYGCGLTDETHTLRHFAEEAGKKIGVAVPVSRINIDDDSLPETRTIYSNFNIIVAENEMKPDALQPNRGEFNFTQGDRLADFAARHGMEVRGHTLVWHKQLPAWISSDGLKNDKGYTRRELLKIMEDHITAVVSHYKGKVSEWDVVNECLDDNQTAIQTDPLGYDLRPSVWLDVIGEDFIDSAFVYAHRADPDARLYINEYGAEFQGGAKTQAYYNLVRRLTSKGIPIKGVGFQCHLTVGDTDPAKFDNNIERYRALGVECAVTELDVSMPDAYADGAEQRQAAEYKAIASVVMKHDHCRNLLVWGVTDDMSWRQGNPLLFRPTLEAKPAFFALRSILESAAHVAACTDRP